MVPKGLGKRLPEICCGMNILTIMFLEETVTTAFCLCIQCQYTARIVANTKVCGTPIERQKVHAIISSQYALIGQCCSQEMGLNSSKALGIREPRFCLAI